MRRQIWVLAAALLVVLIALNRLSVQHLKSADELSLRQRHELYLMVDSLKARIRVLEVSRK